MNGLKIYETGGKIAVSGAKCFNPSETFDCGQCFRFGKNADGEYEGIASGNYAAISEKDGIIFFSGCGIDDVRNFWVQYLDLERDYGGIICSFPENTQHGKAARCCSGIHILKQDPWETLCSFIISQNNNIPRIKKIIKSLCENFGEPLGTIGYSFPDAATIAEAGIERLSVIRSGFRAKYIIDAAEKVASGYIDLGSLKAKSLDDAKAELMKINGVGEKVGSCVALFGLGFLDAFPVDVWIKKVLQKYYGADFDIRTLGCYAGVAQQYLFHYERTCGG